MKAQFKRWEFEYDQEKTANLYKKIQAPASAECVCATCKNFAIAKDSIYPEEILILYSKLGIDKYKELYVSHAFRKKPGLQYYTVAHVCFGRILRGQEEFINKIRKLLGLRQRTTSEQLDQNSSVILLQPLQLPFSPVLEPHTDKLFEIELFITVPWLLASEPEPEIDL